MFHGAVTGLCPRILRRTVKNSHLPQKVVAVQFDNYTNTVILSGAAFQA